MPETKKDKTTTDDALNPVLLFVAALERPDVQERLQKILKSDDLTAIDADKLKEMMGDAKVKASVQEAISEALVTNYLEVHKAAVKIAAKSRGDFEDGDAVILSSGQADRLNEHAWFNWRMGLALALGVGVGVGGTLLVQKYVMPRFGAGSGEGEVAPDALRAVQ